MGRLARLPEDESPSPLLFTRVRVQDENISMFHHIYTTYQVLYMFDFYEPGPRDLR